MSKKPHSLDVNETRRFLRAIKGDRLEALYLVALLGLRQGEVIGLRWEDLDLSPSRLEVRQALRRVRTRNEPLDPKTEGSRRAVKLPPTVVVRLREHRARQAAERLPAERWIDGWRLVFATATGAPLNARVLLAAFQRKLSEAGLPKVRFHDLRHALTVPCAGWALRHPSTVRGIERKLTSRLSPVERHRLLSYLTRCAYSLGPLHYRSARRT